MPTLVEKSELLISSKYIKGSSPVENFELLISKRYINIFNQYSV